MHARKTFESALLALRVAARYLSAKPIVDPKAGLEQFQVLVRYYARNEASAKQDLNLIEDYLKASSNKDAEQIEALDIWYASPLASGRRMPSEYARRLSDVRNSFGGDFQTIQPVARDFFIAILQSYILDPKVRRGVEAASRFWAKTKLVLRTSPASRASKSFEEARALLDRQYLEAYLKVSGELHKQVLVAQSAVVNGKLNSDPELADQVTLRAGSFTLINTGGFDAKVMAKVVDVVGKAEKALRGIGLGKVCYGEINVTKTIAKQNTEAFYLVAHDEMFVRANIPVNLESIETICHELGHRLQFKFLQGKTREIKQVYATLKAQARGGLDIPEELLPKVGDTLEQKGKTYQVTEVQRYKEKVKLTWEGAPPTTYASVPLATWLELKGVLPHHNPKFRGFVTPYASTDPDENFAEMVSYYAVGKLPIPQVDMLTQILH